jgi:hypothetical protein
MLDLSILLPPLVLTLTASPALRIKKRLHDAQPFFSAPNFFNHVLADQHGISAMEYAVVAGAAVSMAWVFFIALGVAFAETYVGTLA